MRPKPRGSSTSICVTTRAGRTTNYGCTAPAAEHGSRFGATPERTTFLPARWSTRNLLRDAAVPSARWWPYRPRATARVRIRRYPLPGLRWRHTRIGAAGQRRAPGCAQLQVSQAARHLRRRRRRAECDGATGSRRTHRTERARYHAGALRRAYRIESELLALGELRYRRDQQRRIAPDPRGLLLQNVHVAADPEMVAQVRTCDSPRGRHGSRGERPRPRSL